MGKKIIIVVLIFFYVSCGVNYSLRIKNFLAVRDYNLHKYNNAIKAFYEITQSDTDDQLCKVYASYNLALAYEAIGEKIAAENILTELTKSSDKEINSLAYFQIGVKYFKDENYTVALNEFKKAIKSNSQFIEAKINYELCLQFLEHEEDQGNHTKQTATNKNNETTILDFIKEKEVQLWQPQNVEESEQIPYDY